MTDLLLSFRVAPTVSGIEDHFSKILTVFIVTGENNRIAGYVMAGSDEVMSSDLMGLTVPMKSRLVRRDRTASATRELGCSCT